MSQAVSKDQGSSSEALQYLTFMLEKQEYGLELLRIQEIRGYTSITPIPNVPKHIKGVMNLRGTVLPVVDLRIRFGLPEAGYDRFTVIIITSVGSKKVGVIVDSVSDVLAVDSDNLQPAPDFGDDIDVRFVRGLLKSGERLAILLDLDLLLDDEHLTEQAA